MFCGFILFLELLYMSQSHSRSEDKEVSGVEKRKKGRESGEWTREQRTSKTCEACCLL